MSKRSSPENMNYNFAVQVEPKKRMGAGDYANMPPEPKYMTFVNKPDYRMGIINSLSSDVTEVSDIYENRRSE